MNLIFKIKVLFVIQDEVTKRLYWSKLWIYKKICSTSYCLEKYSDEDIFIKEKNN